MIYVVSQTRQKIEPSKRPVPFYCNTLCR